MHHEQHPPLITSNNKHMKNKWVQPEQASFPLSTKQNVNVATSRITGFRMRQEYARF
jgi:hypothetical protein